MKGSSKIQTCLMVFIGLLTASTYASDCFSWSVTKRANYLEILGASMFYDQINWINLDAAKTCSFSTYGDASLRFYSNDLSASY